MKTGYFKQIDDSAAKGFISIALYPSKNDNVLLEFRALAPNWKLMENLKSNKISEDVFVKEYKKQLNNLNAKSIFEQINFLSAGNEPILMTHGNKTSFCHRHTC